MMNVIWCLLTLLIGLIISPIMIYLISKCISNGIANRHNNGKHHCNECELSFITDDVVIEYKYCPYCGQELDNYKNNEN